MHLSSAIDGALEGKRLLAHPFYRRWEQGSLSSDELSSYAAQYRHLERQLPTTLCALVDAADDPEVRASFAANLHDELCVPEPHVELFESFARGVGAGDEPPSPATASLVELYADAVRAGTDFAAGVLAAYEVQAAAIATTKADALREHYDADAATTRFWDVHGELEDGHAAWSLDAAARLDAEEVLRGVAASRDAWWAFLDERERLAA